MIRYDLTVDIVESNNCSVCGYAQCCNRQCWVIDATAVVPCNETITTVLMIIIDGFAMPEMKLQQSKAVEIKGSKVDGCACLDISPSLSAIGFSIAPSTDDGFSAAPAAQANLPPGKYRMVNIATKFYLQESQNNARFFKNQLANHDF